MPTGLLLSQCRYMSDILKRADMVDCKALATSVFVARAVDELVEPYADPTHYRSLVGAMQYLTVTHLNVFYAVNKPCQHMHSPTMAHWMMFKRVLRYIRGTLHYGLLLHKSSSDVLHAFTDFYWAGSHENRKSTSGYAVFGVESKRLLLFLGV
ncbi:PREDICTED: uncharacterized protein LOC109162684 [Ipomoea nil]|uniref:uncharacterized protein LOC109162684 n=1 Tax=Ipomoea nil TaxID=35883 RepID=UPI000900B99E|nr:PREDICTED: uncharacterized protein LOC109162684 [Ipomoea nil]